MQGSATSDRPNEPVKRCRTSVWLLLIVLLGLGIRLTGMVWGQAHYYGDTADAIEAYSVAVDYARGEAHAQYLGQPNYGPHAKLPGPLWTLFCFIGLRFAGSIQGVILAIILLNTAAIYLTYVLAERTVGPPGALWAALFAATLPSAVYYSVGIWNPNVMPFLGGLLFLSLWEVIRREGSRCIFWVCFLLAVMPHFHMSVVVLVPAVAVLLLLASARLNLPWLIGGVLAGALLYVPYVRGEMANGWQNTHGIMAGRGGHWWGGLKAMTAPLNLLVDWVPQWTRSAEDYRQLGRACFGAFGVFLALNLLSAIIALSLVVGAFLKVRATMCGFWRSPRVAFSRSPGILFVAILSVLPLLFTLVSGQSYHTRYSIVLLAPLLTLAGSAVAEWSPARRTGRFLLAGVVLMTCGNVWFMPGLYRHQRIQIEQGAVFMPSLRTTRGGLPIAQGARGDQSVRAG